MGASDAHIRHLIDRNETSWPPQISFERGRALQKNKKIKNKGARSFRIFGQKAQRKNLTKKSKMKNPRDQNQNTYKPYTLTPPPPKKIVG